MKNNHIPFPFFIAVPGPPFWIEFSSSGSHCEPCFVPFLILTDFLSIGDRNYRRFPRGEFF